MHKEKRKHADRHEKGIHYTQTDGQTKQHAHNRPTIQTDIQNRTGKQYITL